MQSRVRNPKQNSKATDSYERQSMQYITQSKLKHLHRNRMISNADINQNLRLIMFTRKN